MRIVHGWMVCAACKCLGMALVVSSLSASARADGGWFETPEIDPGFMGSALSLLIGGAFLITGKSAQGLIHCRPVTSSFRPASFRLILIVAHHMTFYEPGNLVDVMRHHFLPSGRMWRCSAKAAILGLVLIAEILALGLRFDASTLSIRGPDRGASSKAPAREATGETAVSPPSWAFALMDRVGMVPGLGCVASPAAILFRGREALNDLDRIRWRWSWWMLAGHLAALLTFTWVTACVYESPVLESSRWWAWLTSWAALGTTVLATLIATAIPPDEWWPLATRVYPSALAGLVVASAVALASQLAGRFWNVLADGSLVGVRFLLSLVSSDVIYLPSHAVVGTGAFSVQIAPECSGYEGIGMIVTFLGAYLGYFRRQLRFPRAWLLLPIGAVLVWLANVVRIFTLIQVGTWISPQIAVGGFHSHAGWIAFLTVTLGLVLVAHRSPYFRHGAARDVEQATEPSREAVYVAPMLAIMAAAMFTAAVSAGGPDRYYAARIVAAAIPLWHYRREYAAMRATCSWSAFAVGVLVYGLWIARLPMGTPEGPIAAAAIASALPAAWASVWLATRVIGAVIVVPIAEELAFRGFLTRRLITVDFDTLAPGRFSWLAFLASSAAFGLLHDRWLEGTVAGLLSAIAYHRRGSLGDCVAAHATTNARPSAQAIITGDWSLLS